MDVGFAERLALLAVPSGLVTMTHEAYIGARSRNCSMKLSRRKESSGEASIAIPANWRSGCTSSFSVRASLESM